MNPSFSQSPGLRVLVVALTAKLVWDLVLLAQTYSHVKLGVVVVLPVLILGLLKGQNWALILTGVVSIFWITFLVARMAMPLFTVGSEELPAIRWSNLIALPALVFVLNHMKTDEELREEAEAESR